MRISKKTSEKLLHNVDVAHSSDMKNATMIGGRCEARKHLGSFKQVCRDLKSWKTDKLAFFTSAVRVQVQQNSPLCSVLEVKCHSHCMLIPTILHCCIWKNCPALIFDMREAEEVSHKFNCLQIGENDRRSSACSLRELVTHHCSWFGREIPQFWSLSEKED